MLGVGGAVAADGVGDDEPAAGHKDTAGVEEAALNVVDGHGVCGDQLQLVGMRRVGHCGRRSRPATGERRGFWRKKRTGETRPANKPGLRTEIGLLPLAGWLTGLPAIYIAISATSISGRLPWGHPAWWRKEIRKTRRRREQILKKKKKGEKREDKGEERRGEERK